MKELTLWQIDAFTDTAFSGNPAAVCLLQKEISETWMLKVAAEMNLSETAFLLPNEDYFNIRFFTPKVEIPLCGHATLASAHFLYESGLVNKSDKIDFRAPGGNFIIRNEAGYIKINFPSDTHSKMEIPAKFEEAMGFPAQAFYRGKNWYMAVVENEDFVRNAKPDFEKMKQYGFGHTAITAKSTNTGYDFVSRCFAPDMGINEDPVTGSVHLLLGQYWKEELGKSELMAYQASQRGGELKLQIDDVRSEILGEAVTVMKATLIV